MRVIATRVGAGFDTFGAMLAAAKLYPQSTLCFSGSLSRQLRDFYSCFRETLPVLKAPEMLNLGTIKELILIGAEQGLGAGRFQALLSNPEIGLVIYAKGGPAVDLDGRAAYYLSRNGSLTSYLVHILAARHIKPTAVEATAMALGIHAATSSLTLPATQVADIKALAYLMAAGADAEIIHKYRQRPLTETDYLLLEELLTNSEFFYHHGINVLIATCTLAYFVDGLGILAARLAAVNQADLAFCLVEMDNRVHVVGHSNHNNLSVVEILDFFSGRGHPTFASATIKGRSLSELKGQLLESLAENLGNFLTAKDIMQAVEGISADCSLKEAAETMLRLGQEGMPVIREGKLEGLISRRQADKAVFHGLGDAPVDGVMTTAVATVSPDASLDEIQRTLITTNAECLPVVSGGEVLGIVVDRHILHSLHKYNYPHWYRIRPRSLPFLPAQPRPASLTRLLTEILPKRLQGFLLLIGKEAARQGISAYLTGDAVGDLLLGRGGSKLEILVEAPAISFAKEIHKILGGTLKAQPQSDFAHMAFGDDICIDFVAARREFYVAPGASSATGLSNLKHELYRRDFTVETMAVAIDGVRYGQFIDYFNGHDDLEAGVIRVLYNLSFVEKPRRIFKAVRYEKRYGFVMEPETLRFLKNAMTHDLLHKLEAEQLKEELRLLLQEPLATDAILRMDELGIWKKIMPGLQLSDILIRQLHAVNEHMNWVEKVDSNIFEDKWLVYLLLLSTGVNSAEVSHWPERFALNSYEGQILELFTSHQQELHQRLALQPTEQGPLPTSWDDMQLPVQIALAAFYGEAMKGPLTDYQQYVARARLEICEQELFDSDLKPGSKAEQVLKELRLARLNGKIAGKNGELALARQLLQDPGKGW